MLDVSFFINQRLNEIKGQKKLNARVFVKDVVSAEIVFLLEFFFEEFDGFWDDELEDFFREEVAVDLVGEPDAKADEEDLVTVFEGGYHGKR